MSLEKFKLLKEREEKLILHIKYTEARASLDRVDLHLTKIERACELVRMMFHAKVPMEYAGNVVVTDQGIAIKEQ